jgi:protein tyrosine phosphatase (PTP) superfamily phosphohydrolase (DUF442 family)
VEAAASDVVPASATVPAEPVGLSVSPGIKHFQGLEPNLAGGSLPSNIGLDWLAEKGYKTLIDLREPASDEASFITEATRRGLRYLPVPITLKTFDSEHVNRFNAELDQADARPIYFFDAEGDRAGAMWYIRRLTVEKVKVDGKTAIQEAKALGLSVHNTWLAASAYLDQLADSGSPAGTSAAEAASSPREPATIEPPKAPAPEATKPRPASTTDTGPHVTAPPPAPVAQRDPTALGSLAAALVTTMVVPLAYWAPSAFSAAGKARASLPAPGPKPKSLPGGSGDRT